MASSLTEEKKQPNDANDKHNKQQPPNWKREDCIYTSCYCEENVWNLCDKTRKDGKNMNDYYVIFLSNKHQKFPIWYAQGAASNDDAVIWDYHVIYLWVNRENKKKSLIFDLDSTLSFPCEVSEYIVKSFRPNMQLKAEYKHNFRVVSCQEYLETFYSDRQHMYLDGKWLAEPPTYPCIMTKDKQKGSNLMSHFVDVTNTEIGVVYDDTLTLFNWIVKSA